MKRMFLMFLMLMLALSADAQIDTVNTERSSVTFSLAGQNTNSTTAVTVGTPLKQINGFGAIYLTRQTANDEVVSEIVNARIDGGYKFLEVFVEFERDDHRSIAGEVQMGYFLTPGAIKIGDAQVQFGAGNYTARTAVKEVLGIDEPDATTFGWTSYLKVGFWKTQTNVTAEPEIDFNAYQLEVESTIRHKLADNFEIGATVKGQFDSDPITEDKVHSQYMVFATWLR